MRQPRCLNCISQALSEEAEVPQLHQLDNPSHTLSKPPATIESLAPSNFIETTNSATSKEPDQSEKLQRAIPDIIIAALPFVTAQNIEKSISLDEAPREVNSPKSEVPRPNPLEVSSSAILISDESSKCNESDENLSDSDDLSSECDFDQSECEIDSNSNYIDELPEGPPPRSFHPLDVSAPLIALPISHETIQVSDFQIPTSDEFTTEQSADMELNQLC